MTSAVARVDFHWFSFLLRSSHWTRPSVFAFRGSSSMSVRSANACVSIVSLYQSHERSSGAQNVPCSSFDLRRVHDGRPHEAGVRRAAHALQRQREVPLQIGRVLLPVLERVVEHLPALGLRDGATRPGRVGVRRDDVVQERDELPAPVQRHAALPLRAVVLADVGEGALDHVLRHVDAELGGLREAVEDVESHVRRRRAAREPREAADGGLCLAQLARATTRGSPARRAGRGR